MFKKTFLVSLVLLAICFGLSPVHAADLSLDEVINNIQSNQTKIHDLYTETTTVITSNMAMPGAQNKGPQKTEQKSKMWTKGETKSKVEITSPVKTIMITNGDNMVTISADTGQKVYQDLKKMRESEKNAFSQSGGQFSLAKAKEFFDFSLANRDGFYVVTGVPRKANQFLGKMEFYISADKWLPEKIMMFDGKNKLLSQSDIRYQELGGAWVPLTSKSVVMSPMGKMEMSMSYDNVKVNKGISDDEFKIN